MSKTTTRKHNRSSNYNFALLGGLALLVAAFGTGSPGSAKPPTGAKTPYAPENPITGIDKPQQLQPIGQPVSFTPSTPAQFVIPGATSQQSDQAYAWYLEQVADYNAKRAAYAAAGKKAPNFSFQTEETRLEIPNLGFSY